MCYAISLTLFKCNYRNMARERSVHFLELIRAYATAITSHYVLESNACDPQAFKRRTPKCKHDHNIGSILRFIHSRKSL